MAIVQALLAAIASYASTILNTAFSWATLLLFGKVPKDRQLYVTLAAVGSILWLIALLGIVLPGFALFLFSFVKLPPWVDRGWIRIAMTVLAVLMPALVGLDSLFTLPASRRPSDAAGIINAVFRGYPYSIGMATTVLMMCVIAPVMKIRTLAKRWTSTHIPILVESKNYLEVVEALRRTLARYHIVTRPEKVSLALRFPTKVLAVMAGGTVNHLIADNLTQLVAENLEVVLHPSDLVIRGTEPKAAQAQSILAEHLGFTKAYLTWHEETNLIEDQLAKFWQRVSNGEPTSQVSQDLAEIQAQIERLQLSYEEWEVLFRERLLIEHELLLRGDSRKAQEVSQAYEDHR